MTRRNANVTHHAIPFWRKDIVEDALIDEAARPTKRICWHAKGDQLLVAASTCPGSWSKAVAAAIFKAEELRATEDNRPIDLDVAGIGYERNPFKWETFGERASHAALRLLYPTLADGS